MDAALLKKFNIHSAEDVAAPPVVEPKFTDANVIKTDAAVFHKTSSRRKTKTQVDVPDDGSDYHAGFAEGQAKAEVTYKKTIKVMQKTLSGLQEELSKVTQQIEYNHLSALQKCLDAVFPALMKAGAKEELRALIAQAAQQGTKGKVHLIVHPRDKVECDELCADHQDQFTISTDPTLKPLQVKAIWDNGGAEIDCEKAAKALKRPFERALATMMSNSTTEQ